jgi:hypothetical protein
MPRLRLKSIRNSGSLPWLVLGGIVLANLLALRCELQVARVDLNDGVLHYTLIERMAQAIGHGRSPLDFWVPEYGFGYAVPRTYQPLAHLAVALTYFFLGKSVSLMTLFTWFRYLSLALLPLSFFAAARLFRLPMRTSLAAALLAPLISSQGLYGIEYGSYLWYGSGLYTQSFATLLLLPAIGYSFRAIREGRRAAPAGVLLGLTFLSHFILGYIGALTVVLLICLPDEETRLAERCRRGAWIAAVALVLSAFQLLSLVQDAPFINHSRWEPVWKWDSFGAGAVAKWLFTGDLLDDGRLPVMSLLVLLGLAAAIWGRAERALRSTYIFLAAGALLWLAIFCGRPLWGPLLPLLGISDNVQVHRFVVGAHLFLVFLAAMGLSALWGWLEKNWRWAGVIAGSALLLWPMVAERSALLSLDRSWGEWNLADYARDQGQLQLAMSTLAQRGGRVFAGLPAGWGGQFKVGSVPLYAFVGRRGLPSLGFLYHSMSLPSDILVRFNEWSDAQYRLFNIRSVLAGERPVAPFLIPVAQAGRFRILDAPGRGYFDVIDVPYAVLNSRDDFYDVNDRWLASDWVQKGQYLALDSGGEVPNLQRFYPTWQMPGMPAAAPPGSVAAERELPEQEYRATVQVARPSHVLFRMTYHPNWHVTVDGQARRAIMVSPGFTAVAVEPGKHEVDFRYESSGFRTALAWFGFLLAGLTLVAPGKMPALNWQPHFPALPKAALLVVLALPVLFPFCTARVSQGHDALTYFPTLLEFDRNISHGILSPRWAPDFINGNGSPNFVFAARGFYYLVEFWHLLGVSPVTAVNLAVIVLILAAAVAAYLLGSLYFGPAGGWLAAAAYLYAPYFGVDLYVRSALAEMSAFPFYALTCYGFGAYARRRRMVYLLVGAASYGVLFFCHFAAVLLFTPLLLAFLAFTAWREKSWAILARQSLAVLAGVALGASSWLPALAEKQFVRLEEAVSGALQYTQHFVSPAMLFQPGADSQGLRFELGWGHLALIAIAWVLLSRRESKDRDWLRFFTPAAIILCLLMFPGSVWAWDRMPLIRFVQFPFRLLAPITLCLAMLVAPLGRYLYPVTGKRALLFAGALALLIVPNLAHLRPTGYTTLDLTFWTPHQLAAWGYEPTTSYDFLPRVAAQLPAYDPRSARAVEGEAEIQELDRNPELWSGKVTTRGGALLEVSTIQFPGWRVEIDDREAPMYRSPNTGLIRFRIAPGEHQVEVGFHRTGDRWAGDSLSVLAGLGLLAGFVWERRSWQTAQSNALSREAGAGN